jgi:rSAM/selenodomain-associated transferase 1
MKPFANAVIVFVKPPRSGKVKTRLGRTIGFDLAASVYEQLLRYTAGLCEALEETKVYIFHADFISQSSIWDDFKNNLQIEGDLGEKMADAFRYCFEKGHQKVIGIGSDCITIKEHDLYLAFDQLDEKNTVFGPAEDGGYYLIGMQQYFDFIFQKMPWSSPDLLEKTFEACRFHNKSISLLRELSDIDNAQDLYKHKKELQAFNPEFFAFLSMH